jgi:peptidoglycan/xylan/chitin deacetylase (PgdA/CDA1 family)
MTALPPDYLEYRQRRYGMDHDRYDWSMLHTRKPVQWPGGARIALSIVVALEWFPLDMSNKPFAPPGAMVTAYPDLRHYTLRDYGNQVGIYRLMRELDARKLKATAAVNAAVAQRYPSLLQEVRQRGWEVMAHGTDMAHLHHSGLDAAAEGALIDQSLAVLTAGGHKVRGWLSPAKGESFATLDLVAARGLDYTSDWDNDDMPYAMKTSSGTLYSMPHSPDIDDFSILIRNHHSEQEFADQLIDQFDVLYEEAGRQGGRILSLALRPWIIGQPYRIHALARALDHMQQRGAVWSATSGEILDAWKAQQ